MDGEEPAHCRVPSHRNGRPLWVVRRRRWRAGHRGRRSAKDRSAGKALDEMSRDELRAVCKDLGLTVGGSIAYLLERIRAKLAEPEIVTTNPATECAFGYPSAEGAPEWAVFRSR